MGRFEKKIKNRIEDEANKLGNKACNFEEWRKDNRADLAGFSESGKSAKGGAKVAVKAAWAVSALAAVLIICAAIFLLLPSGGGDKGVSDDSINSSAENVRDITKEEFEEIAVKFPFVLGFEVSEGTMHTGQDGLPALAEISGNIAAEKTYAVIFRTEFGAGYSFYGKEDYSELAESVKAGEYTVSYGAAEDGNAVTLYLISGGGNTAYLQVSGADSDAVINFIANGGIF